MISIIISTYNSVFYKKISQSIEKTIGVEYEIVAIENHAKYSLCEAYNLGFKKAKYPYLCFVHEDVVFLTQKWGDRLISIMKEDNSIGLIGVAGTKFKSTYPNVSWGTGPYVTRFKRGHFFTDDELIGHLEYDNNQHKKEIDDVVLVDGIFMFTKREVFQTCRFDEKLLTNFHGYDTDFSLQVFFNSYRVLVDRGTNIIHYSPGFHNEEFVSANRKIKKKWLSKLPVSTKDTNLNWFKLNYFNVLCWCGYLRNVFIRKLHLPVKLK